MTPMLLLTDGGETKEISLDGVKQMTIGREQNNNVVIESPTVSRLHASVRQVVTGHYMLTDLGSVNGTFLNGRKVTTPAILTDGDKIKLGNVEAHFVNPECGGAEETTNDESTVGVVSDCMSTVFVADIRGFTKLSEVLDDRLLSEVINAWCKSAQKIVEKHGGHVDKFIGDCVMASWNHAAETATRADVLNALRAAVELNRATAELSAQFGSTLPHPLKIGVGLNTGKVVVGNVGHDARRDMTMLGDTVNMAFRYESSTKKEGTDLNIGQSTYNWLPAGATAFRRIEIELPGRTAKEVVNGISIADLETYLARVSDDE